MGFQSSSKTTSFENHFCSKSQRNDGRMYDFATKAKAEAFGLDKNNPIVNIFVHAQTIYITYINSLITYSKVNTVIQHAFENLALNQRGMKAVIKLRG